jgi:predicted nucleotidyltransferase
MNDAVQSLGVIPRNVLQQMADLVARHFRPEKIILFGKHARGEPQVHSDVDLMAIRENPPPRPHRTAPLVRLTHQHFQVPVDVVVRSPEGYAAWAKRRYSLSHEVAREGIVLYEKPRR